MGSNTQLLSDSYNAYQILMMLVNLLWYHSSEAFKLFIYLQECWITYAPLLMVKCWAGTNSGAWPHPELPGAITGNLYRKHKWTFKIFWPTCSTRSPVFYQPHSVGLGWWPHSSPQCFVLPPHHKAKGYTTSSKNRCGGRPVDSTSRNVLGLTPWQKLKIWHNLLSVAICESQFTTQVDDDCNLDSICL